MVAGDFNQWKINEVLEDFVDLSESDVGNTRGDRSIDRIFSNVREREVDVGTVPPLETDDPQAKLSDHRVAFSHIEFPKVAPVKWLDYTYRYYNEDSAKLFGGWLPPNPGMI